MDRVFYEFEEEFNNEFHRISPSPMRALYALKTRCDKEIMINLEGGELKSLEPIPKVLEEKLRAFAKRHNLKVVTQFDDTSLCHVCKKDVDKSAPLP